MDWKCKTCGLIFSSKNKLDKHRKLSGEAKPRGQEKICEKCGVLFTNLRSHRKECSAIRHRYGKHFWTEEERKQISFRMKEFYKKHPEKHSWKRADKLKSKPCEEFKKFLKDRGYSFLEEVSVVENRNYSVDICFPNLMLILEINGNQHYDLTKGCLKPYYQERHDIITSLGWEVVEIPYNQSYNKEFRLGVCRQLDAKLTSNQLLWEFESPHPYIKSLKDIYNNKNKFNNKRKKLIEEGHVSKNGKVDERILSEKQWIERKNLILNSGIDVSKFGWVKKVTETTHLTKRQIEKIVKHFNLKVFKRKQ